MGTNCGLDDPGAASLSGSMRRRSWSGSGYGPDRRAAWRLGTKERGAATLQAPHGVLAPLPTAQRADGLLRRADAPAHHAWQCLIGSADRTTALSARPFHREPPPTHGRLRSRADTALYGPATRTPSRWSVGRAPGSWVLTRAGAGSALDGGLSSYLGGHSPRPSGNSKLSAIVSGGFGFPSVKVMRRTEPVFWPGPTPPELTMIPMSA